MAANLHEHKTQFNQAFLYFKNVYKTGNPMEIIRYLRESADAGIESAQAFLGDIYLEGKYVQRDIKEAIKLYKESSNKNNQYAKNNLGVIYYEGFGCVEKNFERSNEYYKEAIKLNRDCLSQHNYALNLLDIGDYDKSIDLLIDASIQNNSYSMYLLCLTLLKLKGKISKEIIYNELKYRNKGSEIYAKKIYDYFINKPYTYLLFGNKQLIEENYELNRKNKLIYTHGNILSTYQLKQIHEVKIKKRAHLKDIDENFYEGFN